MSTATFVYGGTTITFTRSPLRPDQSLDVIQPQRQTSGGTRFGYAQTVVAVVLRLTLRMTTSQKDLLLNFFNTIVNGMANAFVYTDTSGNALTVRFDKPSLDGLTEKAYNAWEVTVPLRVVA